jgi:hypothetical protein
LNSCIEPLSVSSGARIDSIGVPKDYNPQKHILLIAAIPRQRNSQEVNPHWTKKLDELMKRYCPYRYEVVPVAEILDPKGKYADINLYPFAVLNSSVTDSHLVPTMHNGPQQTTMNSTMFYFRFYDRVQKQLYPIVSQTISRLDPAIEHLGEVIKKAKEPGMKKVS